MDTLKESYDNYQEIKIKLQKENFKYEVQDLGAQWHYQIERRCKDQSVLYINAVNNASGITILLYNYQMPWCTMTCEEAIKKRRAYMENEIAMLEASEK